ncbi:MAG: 50S ribosomal protein L35 [Epsilonproteobacteria bacterium]|nr:50S ribosomal protein L35 [Campylobacterota bacterium]
MPKMKTHAACKKRFKKNRNGKVKKTSAYRRHHAWAKSPKQVRELRCASYVEGQQRKNILILMPY